MNMRKLDCLSDWRTFRQQDTKRHECTCKHKLFTFLSNKVRSSYERSLIVRNYKSYRRTQKFENNHYETASELCTMIE